MELRKRSQSGTQHCIRFCQVPIGYDFVQRIACEQDSNDRYAVESISKPDGQKVQRKLCCTTSQCRCSSGDQLPYITKLNMQIKLSFSRVGNMPLHLYARHIFTVLYQNRTFWGRTEVEVELLQQWWGGNRTNGGAQNVSHTVYTSNYSLQLATVASKGGDDRVRLIYTGEIEVMFGKDLSDGQSSCCLKMKRQTLGDSLPVAAV